MLLLLSDFRRLFTAQHCKLFFGKFDPNSSFGYKYCGQLIHHIDILRGEHEGRYLVGVGIQGKVKISPTPLGDLAVFLSQPLAGTKDF